MISFSSCHPVFYLLAQILIATGSIHRTPRNSPARLLSLILVVVLGCLEVLNAIGSNGDKYVNGGIAGFSFLYTTHLVNILWVSNVNVGELMAFNKNIQQRSLPTVLHVVAFNFRGIRTPWRTKNIAPFSAYYPSRHPQDRGKFLTRQIVVITFQALVLSIINTQLSKMDAKDIEKFIRPGMELTYFSATWDELCFRVITSIFVWWIMNRCFLTLLYNLVSVIGVATGLFAVEDFPPYMESMWSGYTLRGFWGKFWHQTLRWPFTSLSDVITLDILRLSRPSLLERYTHVLVVFTISGIFHVFVDIGEGKTEYGPTMAFYQSFAVGIMIEDGVQAMWRKWSGDKFTYENDAVPMWKKIIGLTWVAFFFSVVTPWYLYPWARSNLIRKDVDASNIMAGVTTDVASSVSTISIGLVLLIIFKAEI